MSPENKKTIHVLIVDDSYFMRKILQDLLSETIGMITVVDTAQNGIEALEKTKKMKPDVITMDVEMPQMDGLAALEKIMEECPTPVLMLSSHTGQGTEATIRALELGAVDCIAKPAGRVLENVRVIQEELIEKIKLASLCRPKFRPENTIKSNSNGSLSKELRKSTVSKITKKTEKNLKAIYVVAVASSTGGPRALNDLFSRINWSPLTAFVIVQHISIGFTQALARRLNEVSQLNVMEAEKGSCLMGGCAYVAPGGIHSILEGKPGSYRIDFSDLPPRLGVKPSADIMMSSAAKIAGSKCMGVVLTGMGRDGTLGLQDIKGMGGKTFAQNPESCVVYGMPKSAFDAGVVDRQLPLDKMAHELNEIMIRTKES